jgi:hypothetical protein
LLVQAGKTDGDIDVLAYKDGTLFIIEAKMTFHRQHARQVNGVIEALNKGSTQLSKILNLLSDYWNEIHEKINAPRDLTKLNIVPLLIHNSFEYDHCYFGSYLKISDFELQMLFADSPGHTMQLKMAQQAQFTREGIDLPDVEEMSESEQKDLMKPYRIFDTERPTVSQLIDGIERSLFWQKVFALTPVIHK